MVQYYCFLGMIFFSLPIVCASHQGSKESVKPFRDTSFAQQKDFKNVSLETSPVGSVKNSSSTASYYQKATQAVKPVGDFLSRQANNFFQAVKPGIDFIGQQASRASSAVKSAYNASPNLGIEIGLQKAGTAVTAGASRVSSAAKNAYNRVVQSELGYQTKLLFSSKERQKVDELEGQGIDQLSVDLFGNHEVPGNLYTKNEELARQQALHQLLKKQGLSSDASKDFVRIKKNIRKDVDEQQQAVEKEIQDIYKELDKQLMEFFKANNNVTYQSLNSEINFAKQIQDPVKQLHVFKNLRNEYGTLSPNDIVQSGNFL